MALVAVMLVLMLLLAGSLIGFVRVSGKSDGNLAATSGNTMKMSQQHLDVMRAENLADTGVRAAVQWVTDLSGPPIQTAAFTPLEVTPGQFYQGSGPSDSGKWTTVNFPSPGDSTQGQYKVRFYPHSDNAVAAQRSYMIESVGVFNGQTRIVRMDIRQKNFAQYAYFTDNLGPGIYVAGHTFFNGPVHINNSNHANLDVIWDSTSNPSTSRLFQWDGDNTFTMWSNTNANNNTVKWHKDAYASNAAPTSDADWKQILTPNSTSGVPRKGPVMVNDRVTMPTTSHDQRDAALGGILETSYPSDGVYIPSSSGPNASAGVPVGGIYIRGQVNSMVLEVAGSGNRDQIINVYQGGGGTGAPNTKYVVRVNADGMTSLNRYSHVNGQPANTFSSTVDAGYPKSYTGSPNGMVYSYDDIGDWGSQSGGVSGTIANSDPVVPGAPSALRKMTLCTRVEGTPWSGNQKTIHIDGNILYANADINATAAPVDSGVLGMVAGYIHVVEKARVIEPTVTGFASRQLIPDPNNAANTIHEGEYKDGATIGNLSIHSTLMAYNTINVNNFTGRPPGDFHMLGGYIAQVGTQFGQTVGGTGIDALNMLTGYQRILNYDKRVANQPPPFFPGTGQAYEMISYQRVQTTLQP